ncbi:hypothetical protein CQ12_00205 [Bradyrhizobium jicamae]|uniref:Uncharacterized protein n=1 Tax=Bradyrhizobium jicamae TaxID=280332 RepID=A0A0R3LHH8_9BRAD|nr:hypothetical protein [Bradyrhizobium jicamae]KRR07257.1 hypothetical protein CQ12_00205 [Bradyrhizobium jicamae]
MASIRAFDALAPDFMRRATLTKISRFQIWLREHNAKAGMLVDWVDGMPDCAMIHPTVNQGAACTLAGICGSPSEVHPRPQMGLAADIQRSAALRDRANPAGQTQPGISAIHFVRGASDLKAAMPRLVTAFIEAQMGTQQEGHPS